MAGQYLNATKQFHERRKSKEKKTNEKQSEGASSSSRAASPPISRLTTCDKVVNAVVETLIVILAQTGSDVPAEEAKAGVLDAVFTRYYHYK